LVRAVDRKTSEIGSNKMTLCVGWNGER
jgi:hypothetical protein